MSRIRFDRCNAALGWLALSLAISASLIAGLSGCLQPAGPVDPRPIDPRPSPDRPNDPITPGPLPDPSIVDLRELGEALARWVESGECRTTDEAYRGAVRSLRLAGHRPEALGPADLPMPDRNRPLTDADRREWGAIFRRWGQGQR